MIDLNWPVLTIFDKVTDKKKASYRSTLRWIKGYSQVICQFFLLFLFVPSFPSSLLFFFFFYFVFLPFFPLLFPFYPFSYILIFFILFHLYVFFKWLLLFYHPNFKIQQGVFSRVCITMILASNIRSLFILNCFILNVIQTTFCESRKPQVLNISIRNRVWVMDH